MSFASTITVRSAAFDHDASSAGGPIVAAPPHPSRAIGYTALALSVICIGVAMNFIHEAARTMPVLWVVAMLCIAGPPASLIIGTVCRWLGIRGGLASVTPISPLRQFRRHPIALSFASISGAFAAALMVFVNGRNGASTAAFLANLTIIFVVLGGVVQGERTGLAGIAGIAAVILGAFVYSFTRGVTLVGSALAIMTVSCLGSATKQIIVARWADKTELASFVSAKQLYMASLLVGAALWNSGWKLSADRAMAFVLAAGVLQSALGMTLLYVGMQSVGLSRAAPTTALRPIVVLLIGLGFGESLPGPMRMAGALLIVVGAAVICARDRHSNKPPAPSPMEEPGNRQNAFVPETCS